MTCVRSWVRLELPRRWRSLTVLALLIVLASGSSSGRKPLATVVIKGRMPQSAEGGWLTPDGYSLEPAELPTEITEIKSVTTLPVVLGAFLALLAVAAVGHALATAVRRRSRDVAVLRALGMTQRQSRGVLITQATVLALVGLIIGIPLGLAVGRPVWPVVTDTLPVQYVSAWAGLALVLVARVAQILRTE
jgi:hypothetical protein